MDRASIRTEILENLDDLGINYYTLSDVNESITDSYNRIAVVTGCLTKAVLVTPQLNCYWDVKSVVPDYLYPVGIYNYNTNCWLEGRYCKSFDQFRWDWELWLGEPEWFAPVDYRRLALVPHQVNPSSQQFLLIYRAVPPVLDDSYQFPIIQPLQNVFVHYCLGDLLEQAKEYQKASPNWEAYKRYILEVRQSVKNLAQLDKVRVMQPYLPLPTFGPGT
jgi:hypothetical protein